MQLRIRGNLNQLLTAVILSLLVFVSVTNRSLANPQSAIEADPKTEADTDAKIERAGKAETDNKAETDSKTEIKIDKTTKATTNNATGDKGQEDAIIAKSAKSTLKKGDKELLWKMNSDSGNTLYLLGTLHVFKQDDYPLPDEMEKAFAKARALIVEVDITKSDPKYIQSFVAQNGMYPASDNMTKHISESGNKLLHEYCAKRNVPFVNLSHMRPWLVGLTVVQLELLRLGLASTSGIDLHFLNEANKQGKEIISLETEEFQLNLFAGLPDDLQEQSLELSLVDLEKLPTDTGDLMKAWKEGDAKSMDELMTKDIKEHPDLAPVQEKLLYARSEENITMPQAD